jgi:hypothetical protein
MLFDVSGTAKAFSEQASARCLRARWPAEADAAVPSTCAPGMPLRHASAASRACSDKPLPRPAIHCLVRFAHVVMQAVQSQEQTQRGGSCREQRKSLCAPNSICCGTCCPVGDICCELQGPISGAPAGEVGLGERVRLMTPNLAAS